MIKIYLYRFFLLLFSLFTVIISYFTFKSFRLQRIIMQDDFVTSTSFSEEDIDDFPLIPNITTTTVPIESIKARYYFISGNFDKALTSLDYGSKVNPHIFFSEFLRATYYLNIKNLDSAYFYSKKSLYGWPKNLNHYTLFNKILSAKKDTLEIFETYKYINKVFNAGEAHHKSFIDSYSDAKLAYLIYEYKDAQKVSVKQLFGEWQQVYESEDGSILKINNKFKIDKNFFTSDSNTYKYKLINDTLNLYFSSNDKLISQIPIYYSPSYSTLIFKNVIRDVVSDNPDRQDQFFKKIDD